MKERLDKLLTVKSIVTLLLAIVFCVITLKGIISGQEFLTVFSIVIAFYYGTQATKKETTGTTAETGILADHVETGLDYDEILGEVKKPPDTETESAEVISND